MHEQGTYFFDYGNSFLKAVYDAGVPEICKNGHDEMDGFIFPSYVEDILGPCLFDYGYGPFRWCCLSGKPEDLDATDAAAMECIDPNARYQDRDNWIWVRDAKKNKLVVGTQCRILYQDAYGRTKIALKFNEMVRQGKIGPVMLGRDHHDTSGTDSTFRETSNIKDGSNIMADMAVQCFAGNCARGMSLVALHKDVYKRQMESFATLSCTSFSTFLSSNRIPPIKYLSSDAMETLSAMESTPKIPVALRSSVSIAMPLLIASVG